MKNNFIIIQFILLIIFSSKGFSQNCKGVYQKKGKDYQFYLILSDSTFTLTKKYFEVNSFCKGKWQQGLKDTILLKCDEGEISAKLQAGYMSTRENKIIILSRNKILINKIILKRIKKNKKAARLGAGLALAKCAGL